MHGAQLGGAAMLCAEIVIAVILTKVRSSLLCLGRRKTQQTVERARTTPNKPMVAQSLHAEYSTSPLVERWAKEPPDHIDRRRYE